MIRYAFYELEFGILKIGYEDNDIVSLTKAEKEDEINERNTLTDMVYNEIYEFIKGKRKSFDIPYVLKGTEFQKKVWKALCNIPYGETRSYKQIAEAIGNPKASRAVGMANNKNPIVIIVPCHRVIGSNGSLVGYGLGLELKQYLLDIEKNSTL